MPNEIAAVAPPLNALFPAVYQLNFRLIRDIHESRVPPTIPVKCWALLAKTPRVQTRVMRFLESELELGPAVFDFDNPLRRVALLDHATLQTLVRRVGAALYWPWIGRAIDRATVSALKGCLGAETYDYALRRAPYLRIPASNGFNATEPDGALGEFFDRRGVGCLATGLAEAPPGLLRRFQLKLRYDLEPEIEGRITTTPSAEELAQSVVPRIAGEMDSKWRPLFG